MKYTQFLQYPIRITGINDSYDNELTAIETTVKNELAYSGDAVDIESVLPYFVFFKFCENKSSEVTTNGETFKVSDNTMPSHLSQVRAWNLGVEKLKVICTEKGTTAHRFYLSKIGWL